MQALSAVALEQWRRHFLNVHMPARRDCAQCVRAHAQSKPHKRVQHAEAFITLSVDLPGKLSPGDDQNVNGCRYLLLGCYTMPITYEGASMIPVPGREHEEEDQPLPGLDEEVDMWQCRRSTTARGRRDHGRCGGKECGGKQVDA